MPEQKKRGFHALEERIHQLEDEDRKAASREAGAKPEETPRQAPQEQRPTERKG